MLGGLPNRSAWRGARRNRRLLRAVVLAGGVAVLGACPSVGRVGAVAPTDPTVEPASASTEPPTGPDEPCADPNGTATALLVHPSDVWDDGSGAAVDAVVTLDLGADPASLLPGVPSLTSTVLRVPCRLEARLIASGAADVSPAGAVSAVLGPGDTVSWQWDVETHATVTLTLQLSGADSPSAHRIDVVVVDEQPSPTTDESPETSTVPVGPGTTEPAPGEGSVPPVGSSPDTSAAATDSTDESLVDECRRRTVNPGAGTWRPPADARANVGATVTVRAILVPDELHSLLPPDDATGSSAAPVPVPTVTCRVEARLVAQPGDATFDREWSEKTVRAALATVWIWQITPTRDGELPFTVELRGITADGERFDLAVPARFTLFVAPSDAPDDATSTKLGPSGPDGSAAGPDPSGGSGGMPRLVVPASATVALLGGAALLLHRRRLSSARTGRFRTAPVAGALGALGGGALGANPLGPTRVFLSYSRRDGVAAGRLSEELEALGWEVWQDTEDIVGGESWRRSVVDGLQAAHAVILIVSPNSMASTNVERELTIADDEGKPVFPVMIAETNLVSGFKYLLAGVQIIDISGPAHRDGMSRLVQAIEAHRRGADGVDGAGGADGSGGQGGEDATPP